MWVNLNLTRSTIIRSPCEPELEQNAISGTAASAFHLLIQGQIVLSQGMNIGFKKNVLQNYMYFPYFY